MASAEKGGKAPDPCSLLTREELQKVTGRTDVMRVNNMPDVLASGRPACTMDAGGKGTTIEFVIFTRENRKPLVTPKGAEALSGIGEGAYLEIREQNAAVFAVRGGFALRVGVSGEEETPEAVRRFAVEAAKVAIVKLK